MSDLKLPDLNRVLLSGRLTHEPDRRYAADGTPVTRFNLAFHRRYQDSQGAWAEHTGFVTVMTYRRLAEVCGQHLHKGSPVVVEGRLQMREWNAPQGGKRQRLEVRAESVHFMEKIGGAAPEGARAAESPEAGDLF